MKFYLFVTKRIWGVWSDQLSQPAQRIEELVRLADSLGLTNPNESTQKVMTATLLLGMTKGDMQISMTDAKSLLDDIKTCIKLSRKDGTRNTTEPYLCTRMTHGFSKEAIRSCLRAHIRSTAHNQIMPQEVALLTSGPSDVLSAGYLPEGPTHQWLRCH